MDQSIGSSPITHYSPQNRMVWVRRGMFWFALIGLFAATYLLYTYTTNTDLRCGPLHGCEIVKNSAWAHWFGIPTPAFGVAFYLLIVTISIYRAYAPHKRASLVRGLFMAAAWAGFLESFYLTSVQSFVIHAFCTWCLVSAAAATGIFALVWLDRRHELGIEASLKELKLIFVYLVVFLLVGATAMYFLVRPTAPQTVQLNMVQGTPEKLYVPTSTSSAMVTSTDESTSAAEATSSPKDQKSIGGDDAADAKRQAATAEKKPSDDEVRYPVIATTTPVEGPMTAKVTLVEFMDFQCPACGLYYKLVIQPLRDKYHGRIRFAVRHFPLVEYHPLAMGAAIAGVCAERQGEFFPFYDKLYQNQQALARSDLEGYASDLGMDLGKFETCLDDPSAQAQAIYDYNAGQSFGITGTPTLIINDSLIDGTPNLDALSQLIDERL